MHTAQKLLLVCLLLIPIISYSQFPTAIGTKWEYFQFYEDQAVAQAIIPSFEDLVVADTLAGGNTYHVVHRTGVLYRNESSPGFDRFDTLDGTYYYRVTGTQVRVLDSVHLGTAHERLLYEFGLSLGDTLQEKVHNLLNLTRPGSIFDNTYPFFYYNYDSVCAQFGPCDTVFVVDTILAIPPWWPAAYTYGSTRSIHFLPDVGTIYSNPLILALDVFGQSYFLKQLTSGGQVLYTNPGILSAVGEALPDYFLHVMPNPGSDHLQVKASSPIKSIRLVDATGKTVLQQQFDDLDTEEQLGVTALARGLYWLVVQGESQVATKAVVLR